MSLYHSEEDALEAISKEAESFHVAVVEVILQFELLLTQISQPKINRLHKIQLLQVTASDSCGNFRFLEMAQDIPTIG